MASTTRADRRRAQAVATAALRQAAATGVTLPPTLRLWSLVGEGGITRPGMSGEPEEPEEASPPIGDRAADGAATSEPQGLGAGGMAAVLEAVTPAEVRQANGLHVTPTWLADELVELALDGLDVAPDGLAICDPACGGGAFLVSAARALHARGVPRGDVVRELVWGADVDPVGLATAEVALVLWAGEAPPPGRLVVGDPLARGGGLWPDGPADGFGAVVGNPPFLNQLGRATVRPAKVTQRLRRRFGAAVRPYTDTAWLFLLLACELVRRGGRVTLVQPLSLVGARDAAVIRDALADRADLRHLWVERRRSFAAGVKVCAPILEIHRRDDATRQSAAGRGTAAPQRAQQTWGDHLADAMGVPQVDVRGRQRLGDRATVLAGFRDEYYGLVPLVREAGGDAGRDGTASIGRDGRPGPAGERPLVTAGVIDWGRCAWGERPIRFAKRRWAAPVVDLARLGPDAGSDAEELIRDAARWVARSAGPKILVATQTRVVEAAVDEEGWWVPSVPVLTVLPRDPDDLWALAAALSAPTATAWLLRRAPETGLSRGALKIAAPDLVDLPLPDDGPAWAAAAASLRAYTGVPTDAHLDAFTEAAAEAYQAPPAVVTWWRARLPPSAGSGRSQADQVGTSPSASGSSTSGAHL